MKKITNREYKMAGAFTLVVGTFLLAMSLGFLRTSKPLAVIALIALSAMPVLFGLISLLTKPIRSVLILGPASLDIDFLTLMIVRGILFPEVRKWWNTDNPEAIAALEPEAITALRKLGAYIKHNGQRQVIHVNFMKTQITDAGMVHLTGLSNLKRLSLNRCDITDAGLVHLKGLTQLQTLGLDSNNITDAGLVHLKSLTGLRFLGIGSNKITGEGLVHLKALTGLQGLNIGSENITDAGLAHLKALTGLQTLSLANSKHLTDARLVHLQGLTGLQTLNIQHTQTTRDGVANLRKVFPDCRIVH